MGKKKSNFNLFSKLNSLLKIKYWLNEILPNLSFKIRRNIIQKLMNYQITTIEDMINLEGRDDEINQLCDECQLNNINSSHVRNEIDKIICQVKITNQSSIISNNK